jgi:hypothetical protein
MALLRTAFSKKQAKVNSLMEPPIICTRVSTKAIAGVQRTGVSGSIITDFDRRFTNRSKRLFICACGPMGPVGTDEWTGEKPHNRCAGSGSGPMDRLDRSKYRGSRSKMHEPEGLGDSDTGNVMVSHGAQAARTSQITSRRRPRHYAEMTRLEPTEWWVPVNKTQ